MSCTLIACIVLETDRKACGQSNQETRIVGGKPTGVNVRTIYIYFKLNTRQSMKTIVINYYDFFDIFFVVAMFSNIHGLHVWVCIIFI